MSELTCLCQGPLMASHLDFGLMKNSLYWAPPTCMEGTERQRRDELEKQTEQNVIGRGGSWKMTNEWLEAALQQKQDRGVFLTKKSITLKDR